MLSIWFLLLGARIISLKVTEKIVARYPSSRDPKFPGNIGVVCPQIFGNYGSKVAHKSFSRI